MSFRTAGDHQRDWDERLEKMRAKLPPFVERAAGRAPAKIYYRDKAEK